MLTGTSTPTGTGTAGKPITSSISYGTPGTPAAFQPQQATNEQGRSTQFTYDAGGNVQTQQAGGSTGSTVRMNYSSSVPGRLDSIVDANGNTTSYGYDAKGNVNLISPPAISAGKVAGVAPGNTRIVYDSALARISDGKGRTRTMSYDNSDRVTRISYSDGTWIAFAYDADGNLTARTQSDSSKNTTYTYDSLGRPVQETLPGSRTNAYTYDAVGNMTSLTDRGGKVEYAYDDNNEQIAVSQPGTTRATRFTYDGNGRRTRTSYPNGVAIDTAFDNADRLTSITSGKAGAAPLQQLSYTYGGTAADGSAIETSQRASMTDGVANTKTSYDYDFLDRLKRARTATLADPTTALADYQYTLDGNGNRLSESDAGTQIPNATTSYAYNEFNQLISLTKGATSRSFAYDADGNQTSDGAGCTSSFDVRDAYGTLCGVTESFLGAGQDEPLTDGTKTLSTTVLGLGERTSTSGTQYFYTRDENGSLVSQRGSGADGFFLFDALGSVTGLTDPSGNLTRSFKYDPYGNVTGETGTAAVYNRYAGGYTDTGNLVHFGQRFYDPTLGRWTQPDPLDQTGDLVGGNAYTYAGADPIDNTDPSGERLASVGGAQGGVIRPPLRTPRGSSGTRSRLNKAVLRGCAIYTAVRVVAVEFVPPNYADAFCAGYAASDALR